jgi:hypothetical protein
MIRMLELSNSVAGGKSICGVCGTTHWTARDRRHRIVRDLSCGNARIYLELRFAASNVSGAVR